MSTSHGADQESFVVPPSGGTTAHELWISVNMFPPEGGLRNYL